jgi:hypothetical protein
MKKDDEYNDVELLRNVLGACAALLSLAFLYYACLYFEQMY